MTARATELADQLEADAKTAAKEADRKRREATEAVARDLVGRLDRMGSFSLFELELFLSTLLTVVSKAAERESHRETPINDRRLNAYVPALKEDA